MSYLRWCSRFPPTKHRTPSCQECRKASPRRSWGPQARTRQWQKSLPPLLPEPVSPPSASSGLHPGEKQHKFLPCLGAPCGFLWTDDGGRLTPAQRHSYQIVEGSASFKGGESSDRLIDLCRARFDPCLAHQVERVRFHRVVTRYGHAMPASCASRAGQPLEPPH